MYIYFHYYLLAPTTAPPAAPSWSYEGEGGKYQLMALLYFVQAKVLVTQVAPLRRHGNSSWQVLSLTLPHHLYSLQISTVFSINFQHCFC